MTGGFTTSWRERIDSLARRSPARLTLLVFTAVIAVVTALLSLPVASRGRSPVPFVDALFTAVSAVSVTGSTTVPTPAYWTTFGHLVILAGIKVGGLGVMTLASILGLAVSRRIGLTQRLLTAAETHTSRLGEVGSLVRAVILTSVFLELCLAVVLIPRFIVLGESVGRALWDGLFMSVSIFNNAGFVILPEGLSPHLGDWWLAMPLIIGTFAGSLGFPVILSIAKHRRDLGRISLHAKLSITASAALFFLGAVLIAALEWTNPRTLGGLAPLERILPAMVTSMSSRSSGFATVDIEAMRESTWLMTEALMFIGGGSASTAGGIKVTTFAVMVLAIVAEARGDRDIEAFGRRLDHSTVRLAIAVSFLGATLVGLGTLALLVLTDLHLDVVLFEVISAFATCGLSTGITADLTDPAKYVLAVLMFAGRTGTMTVAAALAVRERRRVIRMPEERPIIG